MGREKRENWKKRENRKREEENRKRVLFKQIHF
jgi:hypothetical protein